MKRNGTDQLADAPALDINSINISKHARERIMDMAVEPEEVRDCIMKPRNAHRSTQYGDWYYSRGRITLAVAFDDNGTVTVATVLWFKPGGWRADAALAPMPKGREVRKNMFASAAA